jgi:hypothetical protein
VTFRTPSPRSSHASPPLTQQPAPGQFSASKYNRTYTIQQSLGFKNKPKPVLSTNQLPHRARAGCSRSPTPIHTALEAHANSKVRISPCLARKMKVAVPVRKADVVSYVSYPSLEGGVGGSFARWVCIFIFLHIISEFFFYSVAIMRRPHSQFEVGDG